MGKKSHKNYNKKPSNCVLQINNTTQLNLFDNLRIIEEYRKKCYDVLTNDEQSRKILFYPLF